MTSLIFGAIYLGHSAIVGHRHEKKRVKNYERWEGLRDEYDEQRKIQRQSRSLDIQRTGQGFEDNDRPILTLRDQQEANDARTSWRPQEMWNEEYDQRPLPSQRQSMDMGSLQTQHHPQMTPRSTTLSNGYNASANGSATQLTAQQTGYHGVGPMRATPTGATWDDGLPRPLAVSRRNLDERVPSALGRSSSLREQASRSRSNLGSANSSQHNLSNAPSPMLAQSESSANRGSNEDLNRNNPFEAGNRFDAQQKVNSPVQGSFDVGNGANLNNPFERHNRFDQPLASSTNIPPFRTQSQGAIGMPSQLPPQPLQAQPSNNPFEAGNRFDQPQHRMSLPQAGPSSNNPFESFAGVQQHQHPMAPIAEGKTPAGEKDMSEWWK